ncbi:MAG: divergent PAP2 family protein [Candidatus Eisenbacteria bacterium]|nr:divergent PAP2 family protein [Candidatus Eisenbacteria bacterium]
MPPILENQLLWPAMVAATAAQVIKVITHVSTDGWAGASGRFWETGGMPSSHSAGVTALAFSAGLEVGWGSPTFAVAAVFAYIVIYDALGVRRAAGMHAALLNELVVQLRHLLDEGFQPGTLRTLLGHSSPQVFAGIALGIVVAFLFAR